MSDKLKKGTKVRFVPKNEAFPLDYSLEGIVPGDTGYVTHEEAFNGDDVIVTLTRRDGVEIDNFFAFKEDLEVIND